MKLIVSAAVRNYYLLGEGKFHVHFLLCPNPVNSLSLSCEDYELNLNIYFTNGFVTWNCTISTLYLLFMLCSLPFWGTVLYNELINQVN